MKNVWRYTRNGFSARMPPNTTNIMVWATITASCFHLTKTTLWAPQAPQARWTQCFFSAVSFRSINVIHSANWTLKALDSQCLLRCVFCECAQTITCVLPNVFFIILFVARALEVLDLSCEIKRYTFRCVCFCIVRFRTAKQVLLACAQICKNV